MRTKADLDLALPCSDAAAELALKYVNLGVKASTKPDGTPDSEVARPVRGFRAACAVGLVGLMALGGSGCSDSEDLPRKAAILSAEVGGTTLALSIDACNAQSNVARVDESDREVLVTVTTDDPVGGAQCSDVVEVQLAAPLADRMLVDASSGDPVTKLLLR